MTTMGMKRNLDEPRKGLKRGAPLKSGGPLRKFSAKKRRQMRENKINLYELLSAQHFIYGFERCELKSFFKTPCGPDGEAFVVEHVLSWRDQKKTDISKLQVACPRHNLEKGSLVMDGRTPEMRGYLKELQKIKESDRNE